jgi:hypothetical protein
VRLAQILANLLNNAARYTDDGGQITVRAHREGGSAVIAVCDNGVGIAAEALPRMFAMFTRGAPASAVAGRPRHRPRARRAAWLKCTAARSMRAATALAAAASSRCGCRWPTRRRRTPRRRPAMRRR